MKFICKTKGTADTDWNETIIEAESLKDAQKKAEQIYGFENDEGVKKIDTKLLKVKISKVADGSTSTSNAEAE